MAMQLELPNVAAVPDVQADILDDMDDEEETLDDKEETPNEA